MKLHSLAALVGLVTAAHYMGEVESIQNSNSRSPGVTTSVSTENCRHIEDIRAVAGEQLDKLLFSQGHVVRVDEFISECAHTGDYPSHIMSVFIRKELKRNENLIRGVRNRIDRTTKRDDKKEAGDYKRRLSKLELTRKALDLFEESIETRESYEKEYRNLSAQIVEQEMLRLGELGLHKEAETLKPSYLALIKDSSLSGPACRIENVSGCTGKKPKKEEINLDLGLLENSNQTKEK